MVVITSQRHFLSHFPTGKRYTLNIKDTLLPQDPITRREQSTVSYEYNFQLPTDDSPNGAVRQLDIPWNTFEATYRGRKDDTAAPLNPAEVKRFGIMMRRCVNPFLEILYCI
jgi:hypothetical protein